MPLAAGNTRACIPCFEKKLKCDRETPCSRCVKRQTECLYSHVEKPRKAPQRNAKRIKEMEARLQAMESLLQSTKEAAPKDSGFELQNKAIGSTIMAIDDDADDQTDNMEAFSLDLVGDEVPTSQWKMIRHQGVSRQLVKRPLPSLEDALSLLQEYFGTLNQIIPLFDEEEFMERLQYQYIFEPLADRGWWAALNVALALAYRMRSMRTLRTEFNRKACEHMQNALNVAQDLTLRKPDLLSIQSLLGIAIFLQGTPNPRAASILVAAAVKLSQGLGLHRQNTLVGLSERQAEQYKRVFWIGYVLDKDFSLHLDQPPVQNDQDYDVDLPAEYPTDGLGVIVSNNGEDAFNIFRLRVQLAIILSETYATLYSVQSTKLELSARSLAIENLDNRLNAWVRNIPLDFAPQALQESIAPWAVLHLVILYMTYFNSLTMVHSISYRGEYWAASASNTVEGTLAGDPISVGRTCCLPAARLAVKLVGLLPRGQYACIWLLLDYYASALVILLANIIQHPNDASARADMESIGPLLRLLESLYVGHEMEGGEELGRIQAFCKFLEGKALTALEGAWFPLQQVDAMYGLLPTSAEILS
jgi:Fungal specific transcription factor domain/Fungal Zn(2)-Cys(6) binuclear cluster domain